MQRGRRLACEVRHRQDRTRCDQIPNALACPGRFWREVLSMTSCCETTGDGLQASHDPTRFAATSAGWLIGQAVKYMHADDEEGRQSYQRATELLACDSSGTEAAARLLKEVQNGDPMLRWSLLYVLADTAPTGVGELL